MMNRNLAICAAVCLFAVALTAQQPARNTVWDSFRFLAGEWAGEGSGDPGQGTGTFSFRFDLQEKILVRRNRSDYPATKERPAFSHEDLMLIYPDPETKKMRAIYFDNEGHVIQYSAEVGAGQGTLIFTSDPMPSAPRFRLTYALTTAGTLKIKFEMAPPGKPDSFSTYLEGVARRKPA